MDITFEWGTDAIEFGLGRTQDVIDLLDWALLETGPVDETTASSSFLEFDGDFGGQHLVLQLEGSALTTDSEGYLNGGTVTNVTIWSDETGSVTDAVAIMSGAFDGAELANIAFQELIGANDAASNPEVTIEP